MLVTLRLSGNWKQRFSGNRIYTLSKQKPIYAKGSSTKQEVVPTGPWGPQVPFINQLFGEAQRLYNQGAPQYYSGQTVADTPQLVTNSTNAATQLVGQNLGQAQQGADLALQSAQNAGSNPLLQLGGQASGFLGQGLQQNANVGDKLTMFGNAAAPMGLGAILNSMRGPQQFQAPMVNLGPNPAQTGVVGAAGAQGLQQVLGQQPTQFGTVQNEAGQLNLGGQLQQSLQGGAMNPYLDQVVQSALRSSNQNFNTNILPGIRTAANAAGQGGGLAFGGEGIAAGLAAQGLQQQQGDIIGGIMSNAFNQGAQERQQALGLVSQAQQANQNAQLQTNQLNQQGQLQTMDQILRGSGLGLETALRGNETALQALLANQSAQLGTNELNQQALNQSGQLGLQGAQLGTQALAQGGQLSQAGAQGNINAVTDMLGQGQTNATDQLIRSLGLLPGLQASPLSQLGFLNQLGMQDFGLNQARIEGDMDRYFWNALAPFNMLAQYQNFIAGPYGSSVQTGKK